MSSGGSAGARWFGVRVAIDLVLQLTPDLYSATTPTRPTLTSSKGALPTQTTAPDAAPANALVIATSLALSRLSMLRRISSHGLSFNSLGWPGTELIIRLVDV
jgi:hypothetical protein